MHLDSHIQMGDVAVQLVFANPLLAASAHRCLDVAVVIPSLEGEESESHVALCVVLIIALMRNDGQPLLLQMVHPEVVEATR